MLIKILFYYLFGYLNITIEGFFIERFINMCASKNIFLWNVNRINSRILKANINSPEFTGTPTAVTPDVDDNSNRLATTKFVQSLLKDSCAKIIDKELSKA